MDSKTDIETFPRRLTTREAETLAFMLSETDRALDPFRKQATVVAVSGRCSCGCPTIDLAVDRTKSAPADAGGIVASTNSRFGVEPFYWLTLREQDGWLSQLRLSYVDEPPPHEFLPTDVFEPPDGSN